MRTRSLALGIALGAVIGVTAMIALNALNEDPTVTVIVSKEEIPSCELLDSFIEGNSFKEIVISPGLLVEGAVTDIDELRGTVASSFILANEQISTNRLTSQYILEDGGEGGGCRA